MSITVSNCFSICNSPLNLSSSKQLFSFPRADRFKYMGKSINDKVCYDLPPVREKRSAAIGYGHKYDFTKASTNTPAPSNYLIQSFIEDNKTKNKGKTIGVSRENMEMSGILGSLNKFSPGPGAYKLHSTLSSIKWSFRQRTQNGDPLNKGEAAKFPGPCTYQTPVSLNQSGKYFLSKFKSSGAKTFDPPRSKRFPVNTKLAPPGPGQYTYVSMNRDGRYLVSNFKNSKCRTFSHEMRKTLSMGTITPGPGSYRLPSEFGYYETKQHQATQPAVSEQ